METKIVKLRTHVYVLGLWIYFIPITFLVAVSLSKLGINSLFAAIGVGLIIGLTLRYKHNQQKHLTLKYTESYSIAMLHFASIKVVGDIDGFESLLKTAEEENKRIRIHSPSRLFPEAMAIQQYVGQKLVEVEIYPDKELGVTLVPSIGKMMVYDNSYDRLQFKLKMLQSRGWRAIGETKLTQADSINAFAVEVENEMEEMSTSNYTESKM